MNNELQLTTVTVALYDLICDAMDTLFPSHEGDHNVVVDQMLDAGVLDTDEFNKGRDHADSLAVMGTRPSLDHQALIGNLAMSGLSATLGFIVQTLSRYND